MEPAGLAVGVVGLAGLFSTCLQCFEYIEYGKHFGSDYQIAAIKLDVCRLRLSRWATSIGLNDDPERQFALEKRLSLHEVDIAKELLGNIVDIFDDVERTSKRYEKTQRKLNAIAKHSEDAGLGLVEGSSEDASDLSARLTKIHLGVRDKIQSRQKFTRVRDKARWALYEKKRFDDLIRDVRDLTNDLVDNFPAAAITHHRMAVEEVQEIVDDAEGRRLLRDVAAAADPVLEQAVEEEIQAQDGQRYVSVRVTGYAKAHIGSDVAHGVTVKGNVYENLVIEGHAEVHAGNIYRDKSPRRFE